ncbi:MAG TPA: hypothetical protein VN666_07930 [Nitrospira sp.]|nr:hypothetical protein [Nitrospira sp.]
MTNNLLFEPFADCVQINDVDLVQRRHIVYCDTEFGESLWKKCSGPRDGDVDVGVGVGCTFRPRAEPNDLNINAEHTSNKLCHFSRDLLRASDKFLGNHRPSVSILAMMSTCVGKMSETGRDVCKE